MPLGISTICFKKEPLSLAPKTPSLNAERKKFVSKGQISPLVVLRATCYGG